MSEDYLSPELAQLFESLQDFCLGMIAEGGDYDGYVDALARGHRDADAPSAEHDPDRLAWPLILGLARGTWRYAPHPAQRYAAGSLPTPQRNQPCVCGSGRKYKQCCLPMDQEVARNRVNVLPHLLDHLPLRRWSELAGSRVMPAMVADAALAFCKAHRWKDICALLEPWLAEDAHFRGKRELMFDALLDAYTELDRPRKKSGLIERAIAVGDGSIQSAALQRKATMVADRGNFALAWQLFDQARVADPQSLSLGQLEVTLLLAQERPEEARQRAGAWAQALEAERDPGLDGLIAFMRAVADKGPDAMGELILDHEPDLRHVADLLAQAPAVASHYRLDGDAQSAGPLESTPALEQALRSWFERAPELAHSPLPMPPELGELPMRAWLPLLGTTPVLWQSFEALDTLVAIVQQRGMDSLDEVLVRPLLERAELLLHEVLRANHAQGKPLEWVFLENRPALALLGSLVELDFDEPVSDAHVQRLEWLVGTLNPNDNQGYRYALVLAYLHQRRFADALVLCQRYPDEPGELRYDQALALFAAGQRGAALSTLRGVVDDAPKLLTWLLKSNPKPPRQDPRGVLMGGDEEAWIYRQTALALWQALGAMDWLRECASAFKKAR